jgi:hypothetical protein
MRLGSFALGKHISWGNSDLFVSRNCVSPRTWVHLPWGIMFWAHLPQAIVSPLELGSICFELSCFGLICPKQSCFSKTRPICFEEVASPLLPNKVEIFFSPPKKLGVPQLHGKTCLESCPKITFSFPSIHGKKFKLWTTALVGLPSQHASLPTSLSLAFVGVWWGGVGETWKIKAKVDLLFTSLDPTLSELLLESVSKLASLKISCACWSVMF